MATIENHQTNKPNRKISFKKKETKVDLTPMVDLGFLLITFFVFTSTMSRPTVMKVDMPFDQTIETNAVCNSCALTVLLCNDDIIKYYEGDFAAVQIQSTSYAGIREIIRKKKELVKRVRGTTDEFVMIIKPTEKSTFKNFVDITDEVTINQVKRYYLDEVSSVEQKWL